MNTKIELVISRAKLILLNPKEAWIEIKQEQTNLKTLFIDYIFYLALIPAIASFIGYGIIGLDMGIFGRAAGIDWGISMALQAFLSPFISIYIVSWVISKLAPRFDCEVNINEAAKLVAYAYTPALISGVFYLFPSLSIIVLLGGIYSLYILYQGFQTITGVSDSNKTNYMVISIIASIVISFIISIILATIMSSTGFSSYNEFPY